MTRQRSFKQLVRARMEKTGQSYTAARASLLTAEVPTAEAREPGLATSDAAIRERTGRGWEEWFDLLDDWGAAERTHRETARWVAEQLGIPAGAWNAQAITGSYELVRGLRLPGEHPDGFSVFASKTVAVPAERLYDAVVDPALRGGWLRDVELRERTATRPKSARFDWGDGKSRLFVSIDAKGEQKSTITVQHERLPDAEEAARMKAYWRERVAALKQELER